MEGIDPLLKEINEYLSKQEFGNLEEITMVSVPSDLHARLVEAMCEQQTSASMSVEMPETRTYSINPPTEKQILKMLESMSNVPNANKARYGGVIFK